MTLKRTIALAIAIVAAVALAACSKTVDSGDLENELIDLYSQQSNNDVQSADCPDDEAAEKGNQFICTLEVGKEGSVDVQVTMVDNNGQFKVQPVSKGG